MLSNQLPCFLSIPNPQNKRVLHPGKVTEIKGVHCVVTFEEPIPLEAGQDATLMAEWRNKFHQQCAKIISIQTTEIGLQVEFERIGEPVNCESRGIYRVSVVSQNIVCSVDKQLNCQLADISAEGVAVITAKPLQLGASVSLKLEIEGIHANGTLRVQTEKPLASGKTRYGLLAAEKKTPLRKALESLSMSMQRKQLKRHSGAA